MGGCTYLLTEKDIDSVKKQRIKKFLNNQGCIIVNEPERRRAKIWASTIFCESIFREEIVDKIILFSDCIETQIRFGEKTSKFPWKEIIIILTGD